MLIDVRSPFISLKMLNCYCSMFLNVFNSCLYILLKIIGIVIYFVVSFLESPERLCMHLLFVNSSQDNLCKANTLQRTQTTTDVVSLLNEIKIGTGKNEIWSWKKTAVMAAAVAASGENLKASEALNLEILGTVFANAMYKCKHIGQIAGLVRLENSIGNDTLINSSVRSLQQIVNTSKNGGVTDKSQFRETCSHATAVLLSHLVSKNKCICHIFQLISILYGYIFYSSIVAAGW